MTGGAVLTAAAGGVARRRVQTVVVFLILTAGTAAAMLGLTLAADANELFYNAFAAQHGAQLAVTIDSARVTSAELAGTRHLAGVTEAAGPYPETIVSFVTGTPAGATVGGSGTSGQSGLTQGAGPGGQSHGGGTGGGSGLTQGAGPGQLAVPSGAVNPGGRTSSSGDSVVGRTSPAGPLDDLTLDKGRWATRPGEIVLTGLAPYTAPVGSVITVNSAPGHPKLTVVGQAGSVVGDETAWVVPSQVAALRPKGAPAQEQMLFTFASASTSAQVNADIVALKAALPAGAVASWVSWLSSAGQTGAQSGINTPFVVAFGIIGVVLAVLITASVVSAAVVAGYRRIGVLKSIGFTPVQVAVSYLAQIGLPALAGAIAGTALGAWRVIPLLNNGFSASHQSVPLWIDVTVPLGMLALTGLAALIPAVRAGRLSAVAAIAAGQAPRVGHGYGAHRLAGRLALPRPVTIGLAAPFSRPARSAVMLVAIAFGLTAVVLAVGLESSLAKINGGARQSTQILLISPAASQPQAFTSSQQHTVAAALRAQPGTGASISAVAYLPERSGPMASVPGVGSKVPLSVYQGDASRLGWDMTSGTWYSGPGEVVVNTADPATAGLSVGQAIHMTVHNETVSARITGEVYAPGFPVIGALLTSLHTFNSQAGLAVDEYVVALRPGTDQRGYSTALNRSLGSGFEVDAIGAGLGGGVGLYALVDTSLMRLLTVLVAVLAGLGVLNSVLMLTRERVHDLGVFKAIGMTPRQTIGMVTCWVAVPAVAASVIALPVGIFLQHVVVQAIARVQNSSIVPGSLVSVYNTSTLALLVLAGLALAAAGALGPASWAAASRTAAALRAE